MSHLIDCGRLDAGLINKLSQLNTPVGSDNNYLVAQVMPDFRARNQSGAANRFTRAFSTITDKHKPMATKTVALFGATVSVAATVTADLEVNGAPIIVATSGGNSTAQQTSHVINLPNGIATGHRVVVFLTTDSTATWTIPTGWTVGGSTSVSAIRYGWLWKDIDGTEGFTGSGDTITVTTSLSKHSAWNCYLIRALDNSIIPAIGGVTATGTSTAPDPIAQTPAAGGKYYLWITAAWYDVGTAQITGYPTGFIGGFTNRVNDALGVGVGTATLRENNTTEDASAFTLDSSQVWAAKTIAIHPANTTLASDIAMSAIVATDLTTAITAAAGITATGIVTADLTTSITAVADITASAIVVGDLTTAITAASDVTASAIVTADITTAITAASDITVTAIVTADITTAITMASDIAASAIVGADLTTAITPAADITATATISATLSNPAAAFASDITASALVAGDLTTAIEMASDVAAFATVAGDVTTAITLASDLAITAQTAADLATAITFAADIAGFALISGTMPTDAATFAADVAASAITTSAISTAIAFAGVMTTTAIVDADLWTFLYPSVHTTFDAGHRQTTFISDRGGMSGISQQQTAFNSDRSTTFGSTRRR